MPPLVATLAGKEGHRPNARPSHRNRVRVAGNTGEKERLLRISKRGDSYVRKLLVHGARAVFRQVEGRDDALSQWLNTLTARKHVNVVTVALANKTARVAWAMVHNDTA